MPTTGRDLRRARREADLTVTAVAAQMGISRQWLHVIERDEAPDPKYVADHQEAVRVLRAATEPSRGEGNA